MCDLKTTPEEEESAARYMRFVAHWGFRDPPIQERRSGYDSARFPPPVFLSLSKVAGNI